MKQYNLILFYLILKHLTFKDILSTEIGGKIISNATFKK